MKEYIVIAALLMSIPAVAKTETTVVGFTDKGEPIKDCLLLTNSLNSDLGNQMAVVQAKSSGFKVGGTIQFSKTDGVIRGAIRGAIFRPTKVMMPDGYSPGYKMLPLFFLGTYVHGAYVVESGEQCGRPVNEVKTN